MVVPSSNGGPQVCEIRDWKNLPQALRENSSVSPFGAARLMGRLASFHARPSGDFPVSNFTDLRTSITTGYNHKISMNISLKLVTDPETGQSSGLAHEGDSKISCQEFP